MTDRHTTFAHGPDALLEQHDSRTWLRVHEIAEFEFCPRAGVLARLHAGKNSEEDHDGTAPRLGYLPDFDIAGLRQSLDRISHEVFESLYVIAGEVVMAVILHLLIGPLFAFLAVAALPHAVTGLLRQLRQAFHLVRCLRTSRVAPAAEPMLPLTEVVPINWWSLLNAGFVPVEYEEPHRHESLAVAGRPWRVLHRGSLRIPVFRKRRGEPELRTQHFVRMAAYCCLVEECEEAESPYGIVLFGDGYNGVAVPALPEYCQQFERVRERAAAVMGDFEHSQATTVDRPASEAACRACHWGCPRLCTPDDSGRNNRPADSHPRNITLSWDQERYTSPCGDVFQWIPAHSQARELGLH